MNLVPLFSTILTQLQLVGAVIGGIWLAWNGWPGMEQRLEQRYSCGSRLRTDREGGEPMMLTAAVAVASNSTMRRFVAWMSMLVLALVLLIASMTTLTIAATPGGLMTSALVGVGADLPLDQWLLMQQAATASGCGLDWSILAGVEKVETDFGRNPNMSVAHDGGIVGLVQMQPGNWAMFAPPWCASTKRIYSTHGWRMLPPLACRSSAVLRPDSSVIKPPLLQRSPYPTATAKQRATSPSSNS